MYIMLKFMNNVIFVLDAYYKCSFNIFILVLYYNIFQYFTHVLDQIK